MGAERKWLLDGGASGVVSDRGIAFSPGCPPLDRLRFVKSPATLALLATFALTATAAHGHASLQRAEPGIESKLKRSPAQVKLYFTERVEPGYSSVRVVNEHDQQVDRRDSQVDPSNRTLLRVTLPPLPPGTYRVLWRVLSIDADITEGNFTFRIE
jgi:methionine-rich copper-binding protein CopC